MGNVRRVYVEKKKGFDVEAAGLLADLRTQFGYTSLQNIRILVRYDIEGIDDETFNKALTTIFSEPAADIVTDVLPAGGVVFAVEYLPGQYDQRADSAAQCVAMLAQGDAPLVRCAKVYILEGSLDEEQIAAVKAYLINPVDSREASLDMPDSLDMMADLPPDVPVLTGFSSLDRERMAEFRSRYALAMTLEDAMFVAAYFRSQRRDPTLTELRVIDTYWSDHCRHTTFLTRLSGVQFDDSPLLGQARAAWREYIRARAEVYGAGREAKTMCLMDLAQMGMKLLRKRGLLDDLDESEEINACSIRVTVEVDGRPEDWLILFKNETHNHPTEIEPFGGAATCLGGAIRDPLSGRAYVYQAMRVTGSGDPRTPISETLPGKLPQRVLAIGAAQGFSSYGNQVGLATGQVTEIYDPGYVAKRLEIGALVGAAPARNVVRRRPAPGDQVVMLGGRTGRDGCGGATGSSKAHDINSTLTCGAEVQKGNPPTERKLQRLFRNPAASRLIKRCNDFGAGGVCVAIGELAPGLLINLDAVPLKYEGLDGTELAISESQERMAVVLDPADTQAFLELARQENLEATVVAEVTREPRMRMVWRGREIVNIERSFLDTNGVIQQAEARITAPGEEADPFAEDPGAPDRERWLACVSSLACCSQRGLAERFDSTIGAGTVLMPFGGARQLTPAQAMAARLPVPSGETDAGTLMAFGFDPEISRWSPFHGGVWAVVESVNRIACAGGDASACRLTLQEYFERMFRGPERWGKPLSALLGAFWAQCRLGVPAIGGKDSMSGTFEDLDVPPTLVSFALAPADMSRVISAEWKGPGHRLAVLHLPIAQDRMPDPDAFLRNCAALYEAIGCGAVLSAHTLGRRGLVPALSAMALGNWIGARIDRVDLLSRPVPGGALVELSDDADVEQLFRGCSLTIIGVTDSLPVIRAGDIAVTLREIRSASERALADVFPITAGEDARTYPCTHYEKRNKNRPRVRIARPRVFIPVFPGTNCEYESALAFERAGAVTDVRCVRNIAPGDIEETIREFSRAIGNAQIVMIPGGFSAGDEPDGSGKFIATTLRSPRMADAIADLLSNRDGLMLGICNGFQALIKLGLVPYGEIREMRPDSPTLTFNRIGRHQSRIVRTRVVSVLSPWFAEVEAGQIISVPISHGEGRFVCAPGEFDRLLRNGQIATQYVDAQGDPTTDIDYNPIGSYMAVEGITSPDGRILGKMGHSERYGRHTYRNVPGDYESGIFRSGVLYFA